MCHYITPINEMKENPDYALKKQVKELQVKVNELIKVVNDHCGK